MSEVVRDAKAMSDLDSNEDQLSPGMNDGQDSSDGGFIPFPVHKDVFLFDPAVLKGVSPAYPLGLYRPVPGNEKLHLRPLKSSDFHRGYIPLLGQLSLAGATDESTFHRTFKSLLKCPNTYFIYVLEDPSDDRIVASATFLLEQKFLRGCSKRAMLEDVVVCDTFRGRQLGKFLVAVSEHLALEMKAYKLTLTCRDEMVPFYSKLGFKSEPQNANYLSIRFDKEPNPHRNN